MSFTGDQVLVQVNQFFNDASNDRWGSAVKLAALNAAIQAAWPSIKDRKIDSSVTLDGDTYEYTPTAGATTTAGYATLEEGFADAVYVVPLSATQEPKPRLRSVRQRLNGTAWQLIVPPHVTQTYDGNVLHVGYNARVGRITASTESIELPLDYLENYVKYWLIGAAAFRKPNFDVAVYKELLPEWRNSYQAARIANARGYEALLPVVYDYGSTAGYDTNAGKYLGSSLG